MITFVIKQEEPCEARVSSTVPWECKGEIPSHDQIRRNIMKTDIIIEIINFGRQNLIGINNGVTSEEIHNHLISKGLLQNNFNDKVKLNILIGQIFTDTGENVGRMMLKVESCFAIIEYDELNEARRSAKSANYWALTALVVSIISTFISIYFNVVQLKTPTEIKQEQIDQFILLSEKLNNKLVDSVNGNINKIHNDFILIDSILYKTYRKNVKKKK